MVYNKDKDLVFVYRPDGLWNEHEYVYEMHHLEQQVPAPVTAYQDLTINRKDGILNIYDMSTRDYLKFYNEDKYWNLELKEEFINQTRSMLKNSSCKYDGQLFYVNSRADDETTLTVSYRISNRYSFSNSKLTENFKRQSRSTEKLRFQRSTKINSTRTLKEERNRSLKLDETMLSNCNTKL